MATTATTTTATQPRAQMAAQGSVSSSASVRPYKDFLTPLLHRRFTHAALLTLLFCWIGAIYLSTSKSWIWWWFPLGTAGLRALLLFIPCLAVFIAQVMNMEVGGRNTTSGFETWVQRATESRTWMTLLWYCFSGWFFGEVYIWSSSEEAELGWIDYGRAYERPRANENPVVLRCLFMLFSVASAIGFLGSGRDNVKIEEVEKTVQQLQKEGRESKVPEPLRLLYAQAGAVLRHTLSWTFVGLVFAALTYLLVLRTLAWNWMAYPLARLMVRNLPENSGPSGIIHGSMLFRQAVSGCSMLVALWEVSSVVFTIFVHQLPLKRGQPLTSELKDASAIMLSKSSDPNGSLLRGLNAKKTMPRGFAFWELHLISTGFDARRKTVFSEVDRNPKSSWAQTSSLCLAQITAISERISKANEPTEYQNKAAETEQQRRQQEYLIAQQREKTLSLPRIAQRGVLSERDVVAKQQSTALQTFGNVTRSFGQSPGAPNPIAPQARKAIEWTEQRTILNRIRFSPASLQQEADKFALQFLQTPLGEPFRQTFARRVQAVVFGVPYSSKANILHAAKSLVRLAVASLKEDDYGQVAPSIPTLIRTFTGAIANVNRFVGTLAPHWTDVQFQEHDRQVSEVQELVSVLREGLEEVVLAFGEYATSLGLSAKELREAREAVGRRDVRERAV
ncbi:hypothetical protein B0A50_08732 [Salinomyces thailandicus]|uniref:Nuclear envelope protein n=1 Tax=Salinomyces thailandicus TaxID=706561 RepID=A0A4U0TJ68_9PEZI|nr:hypothetical protein B0A50_08732 [Salinomyces thailandica]